MSADPGGVSATVEKTPVGPVGPVTVLAAPVEPVGPVGPTTLEITKFHDVPVQTQL